VAESGEKGQEALIAAGIESGEFFGIELAMGHIAAAAAGDAHFGEQLARLFQNKDVCARTLFCANSCSKDPCSSAADDDNSFF
jgi:hypothetical protein